VVTRRPPRWADAAAPWPGLGGETPALVNLVVTRGQLNGAACPATILDLAAKGHLMITRRMPGQLWCDVPAAAPADAGLAQSERLALADATRLAGQGGAPFEAVAESCASDVRGKWDPFERAVRAEGRQAGLTRPRLPVAVQAPLYAGAGVVSLLVFPAVDALPHTSGVVAPLVAAFFAFIIPVTMVGSLSQKDRPTSHGAAIAAWAAREAANAAAGWHHLGPVPVSSPAELSALALAVAAGAPVPVPGVSPGLAAGVHPGRATARSSQSAQTPRPTVAWSSVGGQWRLVQIGPVLSGGVHPAAWLPLAGLLAVLAFATSLLPSPFGQLLPLLLAAGGLAVAVAAVRGLAVWMAKPAEASFQRQVIARWIERRGDNDSDWDVSCIAVDDGERSWSFDVKDAAFAKLALGDAVGRRVETTGFQPGMLGAIYRGADLTVSLTVTRGGTGRLSYGPARRWGRALPGIGDEAWQLVRDRTVVFRVGGCTGKVTVSGSAARGLAPDVSPRLAAAVAARLADWPSWPPGDTSSPGTPSEPSGSFSEPRGTFTEPRVPFSEPPATLS
jgi:hypothetical protein